MLVAGEQHRTDRALPGMPPHVVNMAVDRLQRVIDAHDSVAARNDHVARAAVLHSMAVARLRREISAWWSSCARRGWPAGSCLRGTATVLATVALARQALGQPCETLLAEATALDPEADLVAEVSRGTGVIAAWQRAGVRDGLEPPCL